ncbi:NAD-dependent epimerase/dehydratase family protein [Enterobacter cloacae]|uniref:NAD-dependent epimerase/dehydratase family protein n=1 Tax=Enterobacter cloacae TaxID=550 RepID=UPI00066953DB|nr:NAD-dependent epimerase/dehydratase family protein [Enterobacter cloacae]SSG92853.1 3-beta hydroxysteroid dehydrogenase/isomerase family protein [Klebsiella pneumoniae]KTH90689.1 NAD-dependent dehydratase [Enterobacter cloacae subsp. cloacae]MCC1991149.1 NAD-dependent epimerase/dehydratase family protein [Enterobacter cloacae]MCC2009336.1 NAD-dependent epimerase/dehydratase family protein [Enterobacter cloacae]MCC2019130.1 NAD-dependent epimerase/dehydratase family protein [Enterobacter clo
MQTILGASGQIARELARELKRGYTDNLRLVSRHPQKVNDNDTTFSADLLDARQAHEAVKGSDTVYFTAGLPPDSALWERQFPTMLDNVLNATRAAGARFVYFDNTYMYPQNDVPQTEETPFAPQGRKGKVRAMMANRVLDEMARGDIPVLIGRAPEFYGPARTQSFTNALVIDRLKRNKRPRVPVRDDKLRTLIWTPDASRALALLGNTPDAYGQTWHLPCCDERLTYQQFVTLAGEIFGKRADYTVIGKLAFAVAGLFSHNAREIRELLPRYESDNLFDSAKFKQRFPAFTVTTYRQGLESIWQTSQL